jgi:hypothetical protein
MVLNKFLNIDKNRGEGDARSYILEWAKITKPLNQ